MNMPTLDDLIRLPEHAAIEAYLDGENHAFLRQLMAASTIVATVGLIVGLSEEGYRLAALWSILLFVIGTIFFVRGTAFYERNVRYLLMILLIAFLAVTVLAIPDPLARVMVAGFFLPLTLIQCRLTVSQYLALSAVFFSCAAWFALRPGGLQFPKAAAPALVTSLSSILVVATIAVRRTRKKTDRFLDNWRRERERFTEHSRMQTELNDARTIQLSMLPSAAPTLDWLDYSSISLPATEVGGDYFEYFELSPSRLAIVIGDVAGHGVASGLVLSGVRSGLYLLHDQLDAPVEMLTRLDAMVRDTAPNRMFVTLQIAVLDRQLGRITVANAGHPPALLFRPDTGEAVALGGEALPLGTRLGSELDKQTHDLLPGDIVAFYTDGIPEVQNLHDDCYGEEKLFQQIQRFGSSDSARQIRDEILNSVSSFKGDEAQHDDLTLVVLKLR